ncbi:glycoside hydrolase family 61 protein [Ceratobasidium sp. AG-Ba]|nr:glycoside hydrolase family 61 protein [Ceratobasidium sp. AG-Ba]QRW08131.1 glycoside hydrolase family 61 protein [Ceratobasidium sp. AG-Ba]
MRAATVAFSLLAAVGGAQAHGYLASFISGGTSYHAWAPFSDPFITPAPATVDRRILDNGPVTDVTHANITCNKGGNIPSSATLTASVTPGTTVTFQWDQWGSSHSGPVMTCKYIAKCPNGCANFKGDSGNVWVKIDQWGWDKTATPPWGSDRLAAQGAKWDVKIPAGLAAGDYILRHEILGLHVAGTLGGAQFYPSCTQIKISGSGTKALPTGIALPGAYKATDPGILTQLWWYSASNATASYTPPGGAVWSG